MVRSVSGDVGNFSDDRKNTDSTSFKWIVGERIADSGRWGCCSMNTVFKGFWICFARFRLLFSARFAFVYCLIPLRHNKVMDSSGQPLMRRIGSGSIIILMCTIRTITTLPNIIRADRICIIGILRKCGFPLITRTGTISTPSRAVSIPETILGSIFSRAVSGERSTL